MTRLLITLAAASLIGCDSGADSGSLDNGAEVYADTCAGCHGASGDDGYADSLYEVVPGLSESSLEDIIVNGSGPMPAQSVSGDDLADVIAYTLETFGG